MARITQMEPTPVPHWYDDPRAWDQPTLSDGSTAITMPGISEIAGPGIARLDKKTAHGANGAATSYLGQDPFKFTITTVFWSKAQLSEIQRVIGLIRPSERKIGTAGRRPIDIRHPALDMMGIYRALLEEVGIPEPSKKTAGTYEITTKWVQFFPEIVNVTATTFESKKTIASYDKNQPNYAGNFAPPSEFSMVPPKKAPPGGAPPL
jgi:hypothetical protein